MVSAVHRDAAVPAFLKPLVASKGLHMVSAVHPLSPTVLSSSD